MNIYLFSMNWKKIVLAPLNPQQFHEDEARKTSDMKKIEIFGNYEGNRKKID